MTVILVKLAFGMIFLTSGLLHFLKPEDFLKIMPDYLPWHRELVSVSGVFEILLGIGLQWSVTQRVSAWGLILLLIAVFPANVQMTLHPERFQNLPVILLWLRLPLQGLLIWWVYQYTHTTPA